MSCRLSLWDSSAAAFSTASERVAPVEKKVTNLTNSLLATTIAVELGGYSLRICHSVAIRVVKNKRCIAKIVLVGDRAQDPDNGAPILANGWTKVNCQESELKIGDGRGPMMCMIGAAVELDCFSAQIRLREPDKSEDKADKASVRKEVDSEERHSAVEADLPIAKEGMQMQVNG
ncbi:hypothetical protein BHE74_00031307 [Ensete ventricosum]|nr:hypothetical protein BHE74_00031307 [Ensete ventricosum]